MHFECAKVVNELRCSLLSKGCAMQVLTDAADSQHSTLAMLCLAALARGIASIQSSPPSAAKTAGIPQAKLSQLFKQLAPNLQVSFATFAVVCSPGLAESCHT